jgi:hypothetical protein
MSETVDVDHFMSTKEVFPRCILSRHREEILHHVDERGPLTPELIGVILVQAPVG